MTDLFRFVVLRSADWVASDDIDRIAAGFAPPGTNRDVAQKAARTFLDRPGLDASLARLKYSGAALQVANAIGRERRRLADVAAVVKSVVDKTPGEVVEDPAFASERRLVEDVLVAIKLLSRSNGLNATELAAIARGYDAIQRAADGRDPIALRFLSVADYPAPAAPPPISGGGPANEPPGESPAPPRERIAEIDRTLKSIESVPASAFRARADDTPAATTHAAPAAAPKTGAPAWLMSADAVHALPAAVRGVLASEGLDPQVHGLPRVVETLHARKVELQAVEALVAALCVPWRAMRATGASRSWSRPLVVLFVSWGVVAVTVPTVVATKVAWYLNPFYPVFATAVAWLITTGWRMTHQSHPGRAAAIVATTSLALVVAESKLMWQSYVNRDIADSKQGQLLAHADQIKGRTVYAPSWDLADTFVLLAVGGDVGSAASVDEFLRTSDAGDFWLVESPQHRTSGRAAGASYTLIARGTGAQFAGKVVRPQRQSNMIRRASD